MKKNEINFLNKKLYIYGVSKILDASISYKNLISFKNGILKVVIFKTEYENIKNFQVLELEFYKKDVKEVYTSLKKYSSIDLNLINLYIESYCKNEYDINSDYFKSLQKNKTIELNCCNFKVKNFKQYYNELSI